MKIKKGIFTDKYNVGDWVILGDFGFGWGPTLIDCPALIADIGPHLNGKLYASSYDFYVYPNRYISPYAQIATSNGGGSSLRILRLATPEEIKKQNRVFISVGQSV